MTGLDESDFYRITLNLYFEIFVLNMAHHFMAGKKQALFCYI
jgi:hypothetical protein